jgi:hypothetical protein
MPTCQKLIRGIRCGKPAHDFVVFADSKPVALCREHAPVDGTLHNVNREALLHHPMRTDRVQQDFEYWADSANRG